MISARSVEMEFPVKPRPVVALDGVDLEVEEGEFACIVGTSGCGKSTLLNIVGGLAFPTGGSIVVDGEKVEGPDAERGMIFQNYTLFPWMTVRHNIEFGPKLNRVDNVRRHEISEELIGQMRLKGFEDSYPTELSGGMQQRVAIARMLANDPKVLLMDEPFGALDAQTREVMQGLLLDIWERYHKTVLFVTHDIDEAIFLSDVVYVMSSRPGTVKRRIEVPLERPRNHEVFMEEGFMETKREIHELLHEENLKVMDL